MTNDFAAFSFQTRKNMYSHIHTGRVSREKSRGFAISRSVRARFLRERPQTGETIAYR